MSANPEKPFDPSCCEGGGCSDNKQSAQPCGCDQGAEWVCEFHQAEPKSQPHSTRHRNLQLLDHGYVNFVEAWGSDERIIESARMSTAKGFQGWDKDLKLLRFLWEHKHHTPFEMAGLIIEVQAPIFVFREWHRHRTQSYNELSARYTPLPDLYYIPDIARLMAGKQATINKQGSQEGFTYTEARDIQDCIHYASIHARGVYEKLLETGVSRELARLVIPVNQYSRMRASANLRNWLAFLSLRLGEGVQWETKQYAQAVSGLIQANFPKTYELFKEGQQCSA